MSSIDFNGDCLVSYECESCNHKGELNINETSKAKLPWRMDWPMRWKFEDVDFEPGGKDHSSEGGSYTTAKEIVAQVYDGEPPVYLQYDFVSIKGAGGKMSSSKGNLITVNDVLKVYEPEMVRWIFASYKTNVDFSVSFDLDVLKTYEDFDRQERLAYGVDKGNEKKVAMAKRVYELSQIHQMPETMPFQPSFRHLCNILQINDGNIDKAQAYYADEIKNERDKRRFNERSERALYWLDNYAPEEFKFKVYNEKQQVEADANVIKFLDSFKNDLQSNWDNYTTDKDLHEKMYELIHEAGAEPGDVFKALYMSLIGQEKGPKLAGFIRTIGKERTLILI